MWRHRFRVAEAMAFILVARFLVARIRFGSWRSLLGEVSGLDEAMFPAPSKLEAASARRCAHAVRRGAARLPGTLCLPQAMALLWMLLLRRMRATLLMGVADRGARYGRLADLHAWVEFDGSALLDDGGGHYRVLLCLRASG